MSRRIRLWRAAQDLLHGGSVSAVHDASLPVRLHCPDLWLDRAAAALACAGLVVDPHAAVGLSIAPGRVVADVVDAWSVASVPHLMIGVRAHAVDVGPWVIPGLGPCARCVAAATFDEGNADRPGPLPAPLLSLAAGWAARDLTDWLRGETPSTWLCSWSLDHAPLPRVRRWERHPYCGCAWFDTA